MSEIFRRLRQPSSLRGIALLAGAVGLQISPDAAGDVLSVVLAVSGALGVGSDDTAVK